MPFLDGQAAKKGNLHCHPSLQDCVRASLPQTCGRPNAPLAYAQGSRTYKGKRSRDCVRLRLPQTLAGLSPLAPQGENNHPGEGVPVRASVPRIRRHNIIPSELCNSRRHRHLSASRESVKHTPGARRTVLQGVRLHNSDYVKEAPASRCEGPAFELPGEAASDKALPGGRDHPSLNPGAPHFARASKNRQCQDSRAQSAAPWDRHQDSKGSVSRGTSVQCEQSAALIASLGVGPEPKVVCRNKSATPPSSPFLQGRV